MLNYIIIINCFKLYGYSILHYTCHYYLILHGYYMLIHYLTSSDHDYVVTHGIHVFLHENELQLYFRLSLAKASSHAQISLTSLRTTCYSKIHIFKSKQSSYNTFVGSFFCCPYFFWLVYEVHSVFYFVSAPMQSL